MVWETRDHKGGAVNGSLGRVFAGEQALDTDGESEGGHVRRACSDTPRFVPLLGEFSAQVRGTPRWHLLITLLPGPKTGFATSHCPAIEKEHQRMLGLGLPSAIEAGPAFLSVPFCARGDFHLFLHLS